MNEKFLRQLEIEYDRRSRASDSLSKKISDLMTVSAIIMAAFTAIYGYMWSVVEAKDLIYLPLIGVFALVLVTVLCVKFNRVELQRTVFLGANMTNGSEIREDMIKSWTDTSEDDFYSCVKKFLQ